MEKEASSKRKNVILIISGIIFYAFITFLAVSLYRTDVSVTWSRVIQNSAYVLLIAATLLLMKLSDKSFREYGIFWKRFPMQLVIGIALGGLILLFMLVFGSVPSLPDHPLYTVTSQLLVGISEELFFRGFLLTMLWKMTGSKDLSVFLSSLLFSLSHFPLHPSVPLLIVTFVIGCLLAVIRTEFKESTGIPALSLAHAIGNIF